LSPAEVAASLPTEAEFAAGPPEARAFFAAKAMRDYLPQLERAQQLERDYGWLDELFPAPVRAAMAEQGITPAQCIESLVRFYLRLTGDDDDAKNRLLAQMITHFGCDIAAVRQAAAQLHEPATPGLAKRPAKPALAKAGDPQASTPGPTAPPLYGVIASQVPSDHETAVIAAPANLPFGEVVKVLRDVVRHELTAVLAGIDLRREPRDKPNVTSPPAETDPFGAPSV
jgi:hypothetical protein